MLFSAVEVKTQIYTYTASVNLLNLEIFPHILSTELSETKFPSHWYHLVVETCDALQLSHRTLLYSCFSPGYFTSLSELHSC